MRIGFVIGQLTYGGAERQLYELVRALDRQRFSCVVYCLSEQISPFGDLIGALDVPVRVFTRRGHLDLGRVVKLAARLRQDRIDLVHAFLFLANGYALAACRLAGVRHLITSLRNCKRVGPLMSWSNRLAFRRSDVIVCNGLAVRAYLGTHYGAPLARSVVIYNGVDVQRFTARSRCDGGADTPGETGERLVLTIGRLVPQKDIRLFLDAAALLSREDDRVCFRIIGDGPERAALEQTAHRMGLHDRVAFLGERSDIPELLRQADVFWLTSAWEGFPNVLIEALACGTPVIARDVGACAEIVEDGVQGYLVAERQAERFAHLTQQLLADPDRALAMGQAGRRLVEEKFSVQTMVQRTEHIYECIRNAGHVHPLLST